MRISTVCLDKLHATQDLVVGQVHSVFAHSFNIEIVGELLHVGVVDTPLSCIGMALTQDEMSACLSCVRVHDRVVVRAETLRIYTHARVITLSLAQAEVCSLRVPFCGGNGFSGMDVLLNQELSASNLGERIGLPWPDRSQEAVLELARFSAACMALANKGCEISRQPGDLLEQVETVSSLDIRPEDGLSGTNKPETELDVRFRAAERGMRRAVGYLIGRGLGLTPSGDDVLMGFGTGLRYLFGASASHAIASYFAEVLAVVPGKTTAVSEAYLKAMCKGYANEDYLGLLAALDACNAQDVQTSVERVLLVGHTSGADGLLGFGAAFCCLI